MTKIINNIISKTFNNSSNMVKDSIMVDKWVTTRINTSNRCNTTLINFSSSNKWQAMVLHNKQLHNKLLKLLKVDLNCQQSLLHLNQRIDLM